MIKSILGFNINVKALYFIALGEKMSVKTDQYPPKRKRNENAIPDYAFLFENTSDKKIDGNKKIFRKLVKFNRGRILASTLIYFLQASPTWILPIITANVINIAVRALGSTNGITDSVWLELGINAAILAFFIILNIPTTVWRWRISSKMLRDTSAGIKSSVVRKLQSLSITYHKDVESGKIQTKFLKDTDTLDAFFSCIIFSVIPAIVGVVVSTAISVYKNGIVALFFLVIIPVNVGVSFAFRKTIRTRYKDYRLKTESMSVKLTNMLGMFAVTKAHGLETTEVSSVERSIKDLHDSGINVDKTVAKFGASAWVVNTILSASCLIFCVSLALLKVIEVGDIVLYQSMFSAISGYVTGLINTLPQISSGVEALNSVAEIMNAKDVEINIGKRHLPSIEGDVEFADVCYKYPNSDQYVVKNLSFKVKAGECIAVVGASGSGKSTIMNLIIGLLTPTSGDVLIDGKSIKDFNLSEYRHNISVVPQNSILFSGTIKENITYGMERYTENEFNKAVETANLNELLKELPLGADTVIGEHGDKLSGGQKQRITIARAMIRNPRILILDEATSALDNISEFYVQKAISASVKGRTTFIVAHRLSTIRDADRIIVMDNGKCVETGTFDELIAKKGKFYQLKSLNDVNQRELDDSEFIK